MHFLGYLFFSCKEFFFFFLGGGCFWLSAKQPSHGKTAKHIILRTHVCANAAPTQCTRCHRPGEASSSPSARSADPVLCSHLVTKLSFSFHSCWAQCLRVLPQKNSKAYHSKRLNCQPVGQMSRLSRTRPPGQIRVLPCASRCVDFRPVRQCKRASRLILRYVSTCLPQPGALVSRVSGNLRRAAAPLRKVAGLPEAAASGPQRQDLRFRPTSIDLRLSCQLTSCAVSAW